MMRTMLVVALTVFGLVALLGAVNAGQGDEGDKKKVKVRPPYVHAVIFYLKKDAPKDTVEKAIADCHTLLAKIPTVRGVWAGRPAEKSTPKFAAKDYDFALLVLFDNYEGLQEYIDHKLHIEYVERHGKHFDRVSVFDFANQKK